MYEYTKFQKAQLQHLTISNLDAMCPCALNLTVIGFYNFAESLDTKFQQTEQSTAELSQLNHFQFRCWQPPWIWPEPASWDQSYSSVPNFNEIGNCEAKLLMT